MKRMLFFLFTVVCSLSAQSWEPDTIGLDPRATYLRTNSDAAPAAVPIALETLSLSAGAPKSSIDNCPWSTGNCSDS